MESSGPTARARAPFSRCSSAASRRSEVACSGHLHRCESHGCRRIAECASRSSMRSWSGATESPCDGGAARGARRRPRTVGDAVARRTHALASLLGAGGRARRAAPRRAHEPRGRRRAAPRSGSAATLRRHRHSRLTQSHLARRAVQSDHLARGWGGARMEWGVQRGRRRRDRGPRGAFGTRPSEGEARPSDTRRRCCAARARGRGENDLGEEAHGVEEGGDARDITATTRVQWAEARLGRSAGARRDQVERAREHLGALAQVRDPRGREIAFEPTHTSGPIALSLSGEDVYAGETLLIRDVHVTLRRRERVWLRGANGGENDAPPGVDSRDPDRSCALRSPGNRRGDDACESACDPRVVAGSARPHVPTSRGARLRSVGRRDVGGALGSAESSRSRRGSLVRSTRSFSTNRRTISTCLRSSGSSERSRSSRALSDRQSRLAFRRGFVHEHVDGRGRESEVNARAWRRRNRVRSSRLPIESGGRRCLWPGVKSSVSTRAWKSTNCA